MKSRWLIGGEIRAISAGRRCSMVRIASPWTWAQASAISSAAVNDIVAAAAAEPVLWVLLSLAAAVSEELTFRGYLQRQFEARTRSPLIAIAGQAELFGVTHGYQGGMLMLRIAILGIIFGLAAWARKSVIPCIVAHFALDVASGLGLFR